MSRYNAKFPTDGSLELVRIMKIFLGYHKNVVRLDLDLGELS